MIRVLHMIGTLGIGGSQAFVMNLYRALDRDKIQFDFIVDHPGQHHYAAEIEALGGRVYALPGFNGRNLLALRRAWNAFFIQHPEYKILHSHVRSYASLYLPIARAHGVKTIIHSHATSNGSGFYAMGKAALQYPLRFQADYYMACSLAAGKWLFGKRICQSERFQVIKNAVPIGSVVFSERNRNEIRREFDLDDQFVLGFLARVDTPKNPLFAVEVMRCLTNINPEARMLFIGDGPLLGAAIQKAEAFHLDNRIVFTGARTDVGRLMAAMDCYLMPSLWEGLGISLIEAQASGLRCVCSEAIQDEAIVTDLVERCHLSDGAEYWAEKVVHAQRVQNRTDYANDVRDAGYDIAENARHMQAFYLGI